MHTLHLSLPLPSFFHVFLLFYVILFLASPSHIFLFLYTCYISLFFFPLFPVLSYSPFHVQVFLCCPLLSCFSFSCFPVLCIHYICPFFLFLSFLLFPIPHFMYKPFYFVLFFPASPPLILPLLCTHYICLFSFSFYHVFFPIPYFMYKPFYPVLFFPVSLSHFPVFIHTVHHYICPFLIFFLLSFLFPIACTSLFTLFSSSLLFLLTFSQFYACTTLIPSCVPFFHVISYSPFHVQAYLRCSLLSSFSFSHFFPYSYSHYIYLFFFIFPVLSYFPCRMQAFLRYSLLPFLYTVSELSAGHLNHSSLHSCYIYLFLSTASCSPAHHCRYSPLCTASRTLYHRLARTAFPPLLHVRSTPLL